MNFAFLSCLTLRRTRSSALGAPWIRLCVRGAFCSTVFPLARPLPSTDSTKLDAVFADFAGTMDPSDFLDPFITGLRPPAFPVRPTAPSCAAGGSRISQFSRREVPCVHRFGDRAGPRHTSR